MKKLTTYMAVGFLSVSVASPASSDISCDFARNMVISSIGDYKNFTVKLALGDLSEARKTNLKALQQEVITTANAFSNVYSAFCKK